MICDKVQTVLDTQSQPRFKAFRIAVCLAFVVGCGTGKFPAETGSAVATSCMVDEPPIPRELTIAAASDLKFALGDIISAFGLQRPDVQVKVTYGSSGNFFAQFSNQAPFDLFLSADISYPQKLVDLDLGAKETLFSYGVGQIVIWVPQASTLDVATRGMEVLGDPTVKKIAIANPKHAPYGRAAEAALKQLGVYDQVAERLVLGENIAQTAQFVETGAADVGVIALSLALAPAMREKGRFWIVPQTAYPPLKQGGVILSRAKERAAADQFRDFMREERSREILKKYGFLLPLNE
jgi:molybdate transport system substrate-binding protein